MLNNDLLPRKSIWKYRLRHYFYKCPHCNANIEVVVNLDEINRGDIYPKDRILCNSKGCRYHAVLV